MKVRILKDWNNPNIFRQNSGYSQVWEGIEFTEKSISECDLLVVLNAPNKNMFVKVSPHAKWLFSQESPIDLYKWHLKSFKYFGKVFTFWDKEISPNIIHTQTSLPWHINKSFDELVAITKEEAINQKVKEISWITSDAKEKEGHKLRMSFKDFLHEQNFEYDLFGKGFVPIEDKFDGLYPYKYSIAIENYSCNDYWTEKIADCFLSWTMPIYYGAKNITKYFPEEAMIIIDPTNKEKSLATIKKAILNNEFEKKIDYIKEARDLILTKYQFFPHIVQLIKNSNIDFSNKRWCFIPKNTPPQHKIFGRIIRKIKKYSPI